MDALQQKLQHMSQQRLQGSPMQSLRKVLEQRKQGLLQQMALETVEADANSALLSEVEASPADNASVHTLHALASEAAEYKLAQLATIRHALAKFADGSYGLCDNCGEAIGLARLEARPEARLCIDCQTRLEKTRR